MTKDGDLPKLFNYEGKRFDIRDVIGQFNKDDTGKIITKNSKDGLIDNLGRRVNEKGYLIDKQGNIVDVNGKQLWKKEHLKNGEFPKIFPFTKFSQKKVLGSIDYNSQGKPILKKQGSGYIDKKGRSINSSGYLIDKNGNVVDQKGKLMFEKNTLDAHGDIPPVFRSGLLLNETDSNPSDV